MSHFFKVGDKVRGNPANFSEPRTGIVVEVRRITGDHFPVGVKWDDEPLNQPHNFYKDSKLLPLHDTCGCSQGYSRGECPCCDNLGRPYWRDPDSDQSKRSNPRIREDARRIAETIKKDAPPEPVSSEEAFRRGIVKSLNNEILELRNELRDTANKLGEVQDKYWNACEKLGRVNDEIVPIKDDNRALAVENSKLRRLVEKLERVKAKK